MYQRFQVFRLCPRNKSPLWGKDRLLNFLRTKVKKGRCSLEKLTALSNSVYKLQRASLLNINYQLKHHIGWLDSPRTDLDYREPKIYRGRKKVRGPLMLYVPLPSVFFRLLESTSLTYIDVLVDTKFDNDTMGPYETMARSIAGGLFDIFTPQQRRENGIEYFPIPIPPLAQFSPALKVECAIWKYWEHGFVQSSAHKGENGTHLSLHEALKPHRYFPSEAHLTAINFDPNIQRGKISVSELQVGRGSSLEIEMTTRSPRQRSEAKARAIETEMVLFAFDVIPSLFEKNDSEWQFLQ